MASGGFPGNGNYRLDLSTWTGGTTIYASISVTKTGGSGYWTSDAQWWRIRIAGADQDGWWTYDFRGSTTIGIATRSRGVGYGSFLVEAWVNMDSGFGQAYAAEWVNIFTTPGAPNPIGLDQATITSLRYRFSGTTDGGTPVREWQAQIASNGAFTQNVQTVGSNGTTVFSGPVSYTHLTLPTNREV